MKNLLKITFKKNSLRKQEASKMSINTPLMLSHQHNIKNLYSDSKPPSTPSSSYSILALICSSMTTLLTPSLYKTWNKLSKTCSIVCKIIGRKEQMAILGQSISLVAMYFQYIANQ
jgi:hypothetical protein